MEKYSGTGQYVAWQICNRRVPVHLHIALPVSFDRPPEGKVGEYASRAFDEQLDVIPFETLPKSGTAKMQLDRGLLPLV